MSTSKHPPTTSSPNGFGQKLDSQKNTARPGKSPSADTPDSASAEEYSIAGKVFILGEYGILAGLPAILGAVGPRFKLSVTGPETKFHPQSPIALLNQWVEKSGHAPLPFQFENPYPGGGGFGASTAQFAMAFKAYSKRYSAENSQWLEVWKLYRQLHSGSHLAPSGADLIAQWQGGVTYFDPTDPHSMDIWAIFDWSQLLVFSASHQEGRKVPTHDHLKDLVRNGFPQDGLSKTRPLWLNKLEVILGDAVSAVQQNQADRLGACFDEFAQALCEGGLEYYRTTEDRIALRRLPGVLGVKGTGALQADAILILVDGPRTDREGIIRAAEGRGLKLISDGLTCEMGILCRSNE